MAGAKAVSKHLVGLHTLLEAVPPGVSLPILQALTAIAIRPGMSVNELSEFMNIPQQTASRYVAILTGRYQDTFSPASVVVLVEQRIHSDDPRKRALFLTAGGDAAITKITKAGWGHE